MNDTVVSNGKPLGGSEESQCYIGHQVKHWSDFHEKRQRSGNTSLQNSEKGSHSDT